MNHVHEPVLLDECMKLLTFQSETGLMVDATLGEGGHAKAFLEQYPGLRYIGVDADKEMLSRAKERLIRFEKRVNYVNAFYDDFFESYGSEEEKADIILIDLGISMFHFKDARRGFSFNDTEMLDMRLNQQTGRTASDLVNEMDQDSIEKLLENYGEEHFYKRIAKSIIESRKHARIETAEMLAKIVQQAVPPKFRYGKIHPATRTFQAIRIAVNDELGRIERGLLAAMNVLASNGIIGVISFHSLEDRIVKTIFRSLSQINNDDNLLFKPRYSEPISWIKGRVCLDILTKKPIVPTVSECRRNPASRSAKLRVARKKA